MAFGAITSLLGGALAGGSLGTLFVRLATDSTVMVSGMRQGELAVTGGVARMTKALSVLGAASGAAFAVIGVAGVREFAKFDKAITESTAIMGQLGEGVRKEMESTARAISRNGIKSAEELAESYFFLASAGLNAEQSIAALPVVERFATAGAFDMALATDLLTDAQSALGLTVADTTQNMLNMTKLSDQLVGANTLANATVQQFSEALTNEAGAALKAYNIEVEQGIAVLAAFADQGVKGQVAGTSLSRILRLMTKGAVDNAEAYKEMNVAVFDANGNIRDMADILADLEKALLPLSPELRVTALDALGFQARVQGVILPLLGTSEAVRRYTEELRDMGGVTREVAEKQLLSFSNQITITGNRVKDLLITVGEGLAPALRDLNTAFGDAIVTNEGFNNGLIRTLEVISGGFVIGLTAIVLQIVRLVGHVSALVPVWNIMKQGFIDVGLIIARLIGAFSQLTNTLAIVRDMLVAIGKGDLLTASLAAKRLEGEIGKMGITSREIIGDFQRLGENIKEAVPDALNEIGLKVAETEAQYTASMDKMFAASLRVARAAGLIPTPSGGGGGGSPAVPGSGVPGGLTAGPDPDAIFEEQVEAFKKMEEDKTRAAKMESDMRRMILMEEMRDAQALLGQTSALFGSLANLAGQHGEKMFKVQQGLRIAQAHMDVAAAMTRALAEHTWPVSGAIMAMIAATGAVQIATILSQKPPGRQFGGPVSSGRPFMVGEGGPELFVPDTDGSIIPNNRLGGADGGVKVIINNFTDAQPEVTERQDGDQKVVEVMIRRLKTEIGSEIRDGRGEINRSLESTFNLRRGK